MNAKKKSPARKSSRYLLLAGIVLLLLWLLFFDSHSIIKRWRWHRELTALREENAQLEQRIQELEEMLKTPLSDEEVERIAREQYGMHRPDETVYRVKKKKP